MKNAFVEAHRHEHSILLMCRVLQIAPSGFYAWLHQPISRRAKEDQRLLVLIRASWEASGRIYGSPRIRRDLREAGERVGRKRVARIMRANSIRAIRGYRRPRQVVSAAGVLAPNRVNRQFTVAQANSVWVTDITYIRTWQGWLYLAVVLDLYSRRVVGWSMKPTLARALVLDALLMALWRRKPCGSVVVHSDQGSQYGSKDWENFCKSHGLLTSMSRRGNCWDNAVAESFFSSLKKERIRKTVYRTRAEAKGDVFDYIEVFYARKRRHSHLGGCSPYEFENRSLSAAK